MALSKNEIKPLRRQVCAKTRALEELVPWCNMKTTTLISINSTMKLMRVSVTEPIMS